MPGPRYGTAGATAAASAADPPTIGRLRALLVVSSVSSAPGGGRSVNSRSVDITTRPMRDPAANDVVVRLQLELDRRT